MSYVPRFHPRGRCRNGRAIAERFSRIKKTAGGFPNVEAAIEALEPATPIAILVVASGGGADDELHPLGRLLA